jgi:hypothetical protein
MMRDASASYWFRVADTVQVVDDVLVGGATAQSPIAQATRSRQNLKGRYGTVVETWEKCDVDPTCCCAEQVDVGLAVRVEFDDGDESGNGKFLHCFAEEELVQVMTGTTTSNATKMVVPFDGMSCSAFKLQQLNFDPKPRRIASFDPTVTSIFPQSTKPSRFSHTL